MAGSVFMVLDVVFGTDTATMVAVSVVLTYAWFWSALPVSRRTDPVARARLEHPAPLLFSRGPTWTKDPAIAGSFAVRSIQCG